MTQKTYRRLLLLAIMLLMTLSLIGSGSRPQAAALAFQTCEECIDYCWETYWVNCPSSSDLVCQSYYQRCLRRFCYDTGTCTGTYPY